MLFDSNTPTALLSMGDSRNELDSTLVLAAALAAKGCRSIVGDEQAIAQIAKQSRRALWLGQTLSVIQTARPLTASGSAIMLTPGIGAMGEISSWQDRILQDQGVRRLRDCHVDRLCVLGTEQRDILSQNLPSLSASIAVTGCAQFDLCQPRFSWITDQSNVEAPLLDQPFILVCTRFTAVTDARGMSSPFVIDQDRVAPPGMPNAEDTRELWLKNWRRAAHDLAEFMILIKEIAASHPNTTVVIRPHPSENFAFYRDAFSTHDNVRIEEDGNQLRLIRAAALIVHSGSTIGVEAVLAGKRVLNYLPDCYSKRDTDIAVAREAGIIAHSLADALETVEQLLAGQETKTPAWSGEAVRTLNNLTAEAIPLITEAALSLLERAGIESSSIEMPTAFRFRHLLNHLKGGRGDGTNSDRKRRFSDPHHVERILEGCRTHNDGKGRLTHITEDYAVIEPV